MSYLQKIASAVSVLMFTATIAGCAAQNPQLKGNVDTDINQSSSTRSSSPAPGSGSSTRDKSSSSQTDTNINSSGTVK